MKTISKYNIATITVEDFNIICILFDTQLKILGPDLLQSILSFLMMDALTLMHFLFRNTIRPATSFKRILKSFYFNKSILGMLEENLF